MTSEFGSATRKHTSRWTRPGAGSPSDVYNPLDERSIIETLARKLSQQDILPLPPQPFYGAGVYALYYEGENELYKPISGRFGTLGDGGLEEHRPVYVGQAAPEGGLVGATTDGKLGTELYDRLCQHAESVMAASSTLRLEDFRCRYLVTAHLFIGLAEHILIGHHSPPWNGSGFGMKNPGSERTGTRVSPWDAVHPGRSHAAHRPIPPGAAEYYREVFKARMDGKSKEEIKQIPRPAALTRRRATAGGSNGEINAT